MPPSTSHGDPLLDPVVDDDDEDVEVEVVVVLDDELPVLVLLGGARQTLFIGSHFDPGTSAAQSLSLWHC
jgi:hypothetical protein